MSLAKKTVSPDSHEAVLAGTLSLEEAYELGRNAGPAGPAVRVYKNDRTPTKTPCLCGRGELISRNLKPGHDTRMFRVAREHLTKGHELTEEQMEYVQTSGKLDRERAQVEKDRRKAEKAEKKAEAQHQKEGEADKAKNSGE